MARLDYSKAVAFLEEARTVCVCGHVNPDGDCLGSVLALTLALRARGVDVTPLLATDEKPMLYDFLEGYELLTPARKYRGRPDVFVAVDVPSLERMGHGADVAKKAEKVILIDHHMGRGEFADLSFIDTNSAAVGMMIWDLIDQMGIQRSAAIATCCYTAVVTDTGRFQFQNVNAAALRAAAAMTTAGAVPADICRDVYQRRSLPALQLESLVIQRMKFLCNGHAAISWICKKDFDDLGATKDDTEELINVIRQLNGVEVAVMLRDGGEGSVRGSIRSKSDMDVAAIASQMGGGGHKAAAGFSVEGDLKKALKTVVPLLKEAFGESPEGKR